MTVQNTTPPPEKLSLSTTQVVASVLATVSATTAASFFGVAGTVIGAALGSVISVVGSAVYSWSIRRTRSRVRQTLDVAVNRRFNTTAEPDRSGTETSWRLPVVTERPPSRRRNWHPRQLALGIVGLFVATLVLVTGFELVSGQPLGATVSGMHGSGVSIGGGHTKKAAPPSTSPTPTSTAVSTPTVTEQTTAAPTATPSASATPTPSATASSSPSDTGSATPSDTPTPTAPAQTTPVG